VGQAIQALDIPIYDVQMREKTDLGALFRLYQHLHSQQPTILHTSLFHANLPGRIIGSLLGVPIIISSERTMAMENVWRYRLNRWTISMVDRVVAVSKNVGEFCITHIRLPAQKVVVIHNGVEIPPFSQHARKRARQALGLPHEIMVCGAVSRLHPVKGIDDLIIAFAQVSEKHDSRLVIVGEGQERQHLEALARKIGCSNRVLWTGYREDVPKLLPAFDLFVQPSHHEGLPNTVLEAMAAGLPVVATAVGGTPELVLNHKTGLLVTAGDPAALGEAMSILLEKTHMRESLGQAGRLRVKQHFSVDKMVRKTEQLYELLLLEKAIQ
jgi:glycosyltransferase involved in cell wall biosynthesis